MFGQASGTETRSWLVGWLVERAKAHSARRNNRLIRTHIECRNVPDGKTVATVYTLVVNCLQLRKEKASTRCERLACQEKSPLYRAD